MHGSLATPFMFGDTEEMALDEILTLLSGAARPNGRLGLDARADFR
jgi:hypothetical protein